jgi:hypothetical protein
VIRPYFSHVRIMSKHNRPRRQQTKPARDRRPDRRPGAPKPDFPCRQGTREKELDRIIERRVAAFICERDRFGWGNDPDLILDFDQLGQFVPADLRINGFDPATGEWIAINLTEVKARYCYTSDSFISDGPFIEEEKVHRLLELAEAEGLPAEVVWRFYDRLIRIVLTPQALAESRVGVDPVQLKDATYPAKVMRTFPWGITEVVAELTEADRRRLLVGVMRDGTRKKV